MVVSTFFVVISMQWGYWLRILCLANLTIVHDLSNCDTCSRYYITFCRKLHDIDISSKSLPQNWSFLLQISLANVNKSAENWICSYLLKKILNKKLFLCVQCVFNPGTRFANVWVLLTFVKKKYVLQYCANCFEKNYENKQNYTRLKNMFLLIFRILVPKINFWLEDRKLGCLHIQFWDFPNI